MEGCIRKWRCSSTSRSAPQDPYADDPNALASTSKTCPLCRIRTRYIIPSVTWPQDSTQKATIERVYLLRLSKIPCRYFTASLRPRERPVGPTGRAGPHTRRNTGPWCPFGNECHYQHEKVPGVKYEFSEAQVSRAMWGRRAAVRRRNDSSFGDMERDLSASIDQLGVFPDWVIRFVDNPFTAESLADLIIQRDEGSDSDDRWDEAVRTELFDLEHVLGGRF